MPVSAMSDLENRSQLRLSTVVKIYRFCVPNIVPALTLIIQLQIDEI